MSRSPLLRRVAPSAVERGAAEPVDPEAERDARAIVDDVRARGEPALRAYAERFGELGPGEAIWRSRDALDRARSELSADDLATLERVATRIAAFAGAQREAMREVDVEIPGGRAGTSIRAVDVAGCYAPGGRFPLPSSVLMTAVTARVAGVERVVVASPKPTAETLAAASIAGADGLLAVGGAQAIAALAYGIGSVPPCDVIVGPGNAWVTAAKKVVFGTCGIDLLAGPSELVVLADATSDPDRVAADLLAQAEHDVRAVPILVTTDAPLLDAVEDALGRRLAALGTAATARRALDNGYAVVAGDLEEAVSLTDAIAPEHLQIVTADASEVARRCRHYGGVFVGEDSAEVAGDYGAGPNHTLPTGGTARFTAGLSVQHFLRARTWVRIDDPDAAVGVYRDAARVAEMEGLEAHRAAARARTSERGGSSRFDDRTTL